MDNSLDLDYMDDTDNMDDIEEKQSMDENYCVFLDDFDLNEDIEDKTHKSDKPREDSISTDNVSF